MTKKGAIIGASTVLVVAVVAAVCVVSFKNSGDGGKGEGQMSTSVKSIKSFCQPVDYKETCESALEGAAGNATSPTDLAKAIFKVTSDRIEQAVRESAVLNDLKNDQRTSGALNNCKELLDYAIDDLKTTFDKLGGFEMTNFKRAVDDLKTWLSSALTYQETCLDGFENTTTDAAAKMRKALNSSQELTENILALVDEFSETLANLDLPSFSRRLLGDDGMPEWMPDAKRRLLQASPGAPQFKPNVTVAADGSGDFKTINEALAKVPLKSATTYVMYIKAGTYKEYVSVARNVTNLVMIGDGATKTIITGNKSFMLNITTKDTATMEAIGNGFFMRGIGVENTAGAKNHQAVALRVQSDMSAFYECQFDGYQDTLYTHTSRQYYRDCVISGTIDFIFGNAQVVLQNCLIQVRRCMDNQQNIVTAQGRKEKRSAGGTVIHNCTIAPHPEFEAHAGRLKTFLGRPWKEYSRTLYIQSEIGGFIDPQGWLPWLGDFGLNTCYYAEVENHGPGADMSKRAKWRGVKAVTYQQAQQKYTVERFIQGQQWLPKLGVPFIPGLLPQQQSGRIH
ncbi:probable pectinesterase/pectinesterase inhibitor 21 [Phragmites australis]|uniref:probable pectinesterase/pectinesterase inhibitor 21 n=1 Tax=Phragmites australis TaxID=29695 RepID=UPI002D769632|nr:probable pectinesterase/pectinesterase inhibitor 21 [Phragmites australis]